MSEPQHPSLPSAAPRCGPLTLDQIVAWATGHHARTGSWLGVKTLGIIPGTAGEKWKNLDQSLRSGARGLPGGDSPARLLEQRCGVRNRNVPPSLTIEAILTWADAYHQRTGKWPTAFSGPIPESNGETWAAVAHALDNGSRGLTGKSSLPQLFAERRGHRNQGALPPVTEVQILAWADAHYKRTRKWPTKWTSDSVPTAPGETWTNLDAALRVGNRGLPGGSSLARLLAEERGYRNRQALPALSEEQILAWADAYHQQHGHWPKGSSGRIPRSGGEKQRGSFYHAPGHAARWSTWPLSFLALYCFPPLRHGLVSRCAPQASRIFRPDSVSRSDLTTTRSRRHKSELAAKARAPSSVIASTLSTSTRICRRIPERAIAAQSAFAPTSALSESSREWNSR